MAVKVDKTEKEALDAFTQAYGASTHLQRSVWAGLKAALGLEFREEEGEGLPEVLGFSVIKAGVFRLTDGRGNTLARVEVAAYSDEKEEFAINVLQKALGRYNDFPKLEALALELGAVSAVYDLEMQRLIARARELTGQEEPWEREMRENAAEQRRERLLLLPKLEALAREMADYIANNDHLQQPSADALLLRLRGLLRKEGA